MATEYHTTFKGFTVVIRHKCTAVNVEKLHFVLSILIIEDNYRYHPDVHADVSMIPNKSLNLISMCIYLSMEFV